MESNPIELPPVISTESDKELKFADYVFVNKYNDDQNSIRSDYALIKTEYASDGSYFLSLRTLDNLDKNIFQFKC
jgi:hypothetical protein